MKAIQPLAPSSMPSVDAAIENACRSIAPSWPLDRQIAVNPYWGFIDRPFTEVAESLHRLVGARFTLGRQEMLDAWRAGQITPAALARAIAESGSAITQDAALAALETPSPTSDGLPLPSDLLDERSAPGEAPRWRDAVTQQVSQYCASYFDALQADWHRDTGAGLYRGWRESLAFDHALEPLMRATGIRTRAELLPADTDAAIGHALAQLGVPAADTTTFLQVCLLRIGGWASWCAYLGWEARLAGATDAHLRELLAIRASWEALLRDGDQGMDAVGPAWRERWAGARRCASSPLRAMDLLWQRAHEISYQDALVAQLAARRTSTPAAPAAAQLVFCIDVRSERLRRALETRDPLIETRGFAGFFGLPIRYTPLGTTLSRPQLPSLLSPALEATDSTGDPAADAAIVAGRGAALAGRRARLAFERAPTGAFAHVEALGVAYAGALLGRHFGSETESLDRTGLASRDAAALRPRLGPWGPDPIGRKADLVAATLRALGLTSGFARLLVLVGHGSQSANNPQSAALECGACGGQSGDFNARALATLLNDTDVRGALAMRGINLPRDTIAIGALHNTTTDEVRLFDTESVPQSHAPDLERLGLALLDAAHATRRERAPSLGLASTSHRPGALLKALRRRARDWAETRPEWGLAGNAAFIAAPRARTRGLNLAGRAFLHDYDAASDPDGKVLELILTAPMVVAHWINLQYYASTVDPDRFGSGNKVLHNVACGRIGVFEGNTGDLRIGLARQSVHDGERWMHAPLRLSVFLDAPRERIEDILARHATIASLVHHQWLHLFRFDADRIERYRTGCWEVWRATARAPTNAS